MNLSISYAKESKNKSIAIKELRYMTKLIALNLLGNRLYKNINLKILVEPFRGGICDSLDAYERKQRNFLILIGSKQSIRQQKLTIMHELIHLKQYANGEMKHNANGNYMVFRNRKYNLSKNINTPCKFPWEKEAYSHEHILLNIYETLKLTGGFK